MKSGTNRCPFGAGAEPTPEGEFGFLREAASPAGQSREDALARIDALAGWPRHRPLPLASDELVWAGRVAWRNHSRCIGRLYWRTLQVRDFRSVESAEGVIDGLLEHLSLAFNAGQIRPILTVFAPACAGRRIKIWNRQVCGYAGYRLPGGATLGDPRNISTTEMAMELGWSPPVDRSGFDLLPLIVTGMDGVTSCRPLPVAAVREVRISHPEIEEMEALGLRWYSVPLVSDMVFRVGGTEYPAAPFNGWYMGTEIGARNLADQSRYDLLPKVAQAMHLDTSREDSLWRDRALIELNRAVLHSFKGAGVRIVDHHTASNEFMQFLKLEEMAGRHVSAQWDWIVPPISASATAVFHTPMKERPASPEFIHIDQPS